MARCLQTTCKSQAVPAVKKVHGGSGAFLPVYNISVFPFPYGNYGVVLFTAVTAYSIVKYRFMDIDFILRKTIVFAGLSFALFGLFAGSAFLITTFLQASLNDSMRLMLFALV